MSTSQPILMNPDVRSRSLAMMQTPSAWPLDSVLPLKRYTSPKRRLCGELNTMELGYMVNLPVSGTVPPIVFIGNICAPAPTTDPRMEYSGPDAIIADGWIVD